MNNLVCIDTHLLIWGIQGKASDQRIEMIDRTKALIRKFEDEKRVVLVPSIVIAEFMLPIQNIEEQQQYTRLLQKGFIIAPFDTKAAHKFAQVLQSRKSSDVIAEAYKNGVTKKELRADAMIVATALAQEAYCIYSEDDHIHKLGKNFLPVLRIPELPAQQLLLPVTSTSTGN